MLASVNELRNIHEWAQELLMMHQLIVYATATENSKCWWSLLLGFAPLELFRRQR